MRRGCRRQAEQQAEQQAVQQAEQRAGGERREKRLRDKLRWHEVRWQRAGEVGMGRRLGRPAKDCFYSWSDHVLYLESRLLAECVGAVCLVVLTLGARALSVGARWSLSVVDVFYTEYGKRSSFHKTRMTFSWRSIRPKRRGRHVHTRERASGETERSASGQGGAGVCVRCVAPPVVLQVGRTAHGARHALRRST